MTRNYQQFKSISVFLPAYNEEANIEKAVKEAKNALERIFDDFEIIVINDGSTDRTGQISDQLAKSDPVIQVVCHPKNLGYGVALKSGFKKSSKDLVFFTDADLQYDFRELKKFLENISDFDAVIGYRRRRESIFRAFNALGWRTLIGNLFGTHFRDIDCAFKLFRRSSLRDLNLGSAGAAVSAELLVKLTLKGYKIKELPVNFRRRIFGQATGGNIKVILRAFRELFIFYENYRRLPAAASAAAHAAAGRTAAAKAGKSR